MELETTRFGTIKVEEDDIITFPEGLVGLSRYKRFVLIPHGGDSPFCWLQSVDEPSFALFVIDPWFFRPDYEVVLSDSEAERLQMTEDTLKAVFVTVTIPPGQPELMTANLLAPLVLNLSTRRGRQVILDDERYQTRHPILEEMVRHASAQEVA